MQATIYTIEPFDAELGTTIKFSWSGNQVFANRCIIQDNETNAIIYDNRIDSMKLEHTIDLSAIIEGQELTNGRKYIAFITVFDTNGNESDPQKPGAFFTCLKTPIFEFTNVSESRVIGASSYNFEVKYDQENEELLNSWQISVYDSNNALLSTTNVKYDITEEIDETSGEILYYTVSHTFTGFTSKAQYKIRALGETVNGMKLDTGYIQFSVSYDMAAVFSMLDVTNIPETAAILIHSNIISAEGKPEVEPVTFVNGEYVDLTNNAIVYDEGFLLEGDYSLVLYAYRVKPNVTFFEFYDENNQNIGKVTYREGMVGSTEWMGQLELRITNGLTDYVIYSPQIAPISDDTLLGFCIIRQNGLYNIQIINLGTVNIDNAETVDYYTDETIEEVA